MNIPAEPLGLADVVRQILRLPLYRRPSGDYYRQRMAELERKTTPSQLPVTRGAR